MLHCVEDMNRLSCPGSAVGRALTETTEFGWFESPPSVALLPWKKTAVLGVVDLFVVTFHFPPRS